MGVTERDREREGVPKGLHVCVCEKVTVEIQIHEHSAIVSQWDFVARFFVRCAKIVGPIS